MLCVRLHSLILLSAMVLTLQADAGSVDNRTLASALTKKKDHKERRKKQSTGNALYRLALEEEERRSRRQKVTPRGGSFMLP